MVAVDPRRPRHDGPVAGVFDIRHAAVRLCELRKLLLSLDLCADLIEDGFPRNGIERIRGNEHAQVRIAAAERNQPCVLGPPKAPRQGKAHAGYVHRHPGIR